MPKNYDVIKEKWRFSRVSSEGRKFVSKSFICICFCKEDNSSHSGYRAKVSLGIAASKKTYKLAVQRNKAKRRVRGLINEAVKAFSLENYDVFFIARRGFIERKYYDVRSELWGIFKRLLKK